MSTELPETAVAMREMLDAIKAPIRTELTRRDHFAIAAMAGLLRDEEWRYAKPETVAGKAYMLADAMEKARGG